MSELVAILIVGVGSYTSRALFIIALANRAIPDWAREVLDFVAPSVLGALVIALLVDSEGRVSVGAAEAAAFLVGGTVAMKTRNHLLTLAAGMGVFWVVRALL
jgi:branched-subunit amino acid transport protein